MGAPYLSLQTTFFFFSLVFCGCCQSFDILFQAPPLRSLRHAKGENEDHVDAVCDLQFSVIRRFQYYRLLLLLGVGRNLLSPFVETIR